MFLHRSAWLTCTHMHAHTHTHTHTHTSKHTQTSVQTHVHTQARAHTYTHIHTHTHTHTHTHKHAHTHLPDTHKCERTNTHTHTHAHTCTTAPGHRRSARRGYKFSKKKNYSLIYSKCTRALTFQKLWQHYGTRWSRAMRSRWSSGCCRALTPITAPALPSRCLYCTRLQH